MSDASESIEKILLTTGIRVGTPVKTKSMTPFIVKANPEGLYILDLIKTFERIEITASFINRLDINKVIVCSTKEYGVVPVTKFCELVGATSMIGRFMPGSFTNPLLPNYVEPLLVLVTDPQADQQAVIEASKAGIPVVAICNSDNVTQNVDLVIPANNRGRKSLATVFWLLTKALLLKSNKIRSEDIGMDSFMYNNTEYKIEDFETKPIEVE
jgi:small subunit ribosomal protein S2